jgi:hypothetical protein
MPRAKLLKLAVAGKHHYELYVPVIKAVPGGILRYKNRGSIPLGVYDQYDTDVFSWVLPVNCSADFMCGTNFCPECIATANPCNNLLR